MVPPQIAAAMVDRFMIERQSLLLGRIAAFKIGRDDDAPAQQAERKRPLHGGALDQSEPAMRAAFPRALIQLGDEAAIGKELPGKEGGRADGP